jgi:hypothetical protein
MKLGRRQFIGAGVAFALNASPGLTQKRSINSGEKQGVITPEEFGAKGDGVENDTEAFAEMTEFVNRRGGGVIAFRRTTYIVGIQTRDPPYSFTPASIMEFRGCRKGLTILGNGARLRCADGLRYGTFDPSTGQPTNHPLPYYVQDELAFPYYAMISAENCSGDVQISDLELDGNVGRLIIGGPYGDTGWQIPAYGLFLNNNTGAEQITRVYTHHHALDGLLINGVVKRNSASALSEIVSEYNGRQGCSVVGGRNYSFANCQFNHTGKAGLLSAPGAGMDIEAEVKTIRNLTFTGCVFSNNSGVGMVADSGDSEGVTFDSCRFIGTTAWSAWPRKPRFRFDGCEFVGSIVNTFGDPDPERAAQFHDCVFRDDPALSPTGEVYTVFPIADLSEYRNVLLNRCRVELTGNGVLPWSINAIYRDCTMFQTATRQAYPRGTYIGVNRIDGNVDLNGSAILGDVIVNGRLISRTN